MREIKFRGKVKEGYHNAGQWKYFTLEGFIDDGLGAQTLDSIDFETIGQATGVKDVNGIEIYEGDILEIRCEIEDRMYTQNVYVRFEDGAFVLQDHPLGMLVHDLIYDFVFLEDEHGEAEIIGNIYDNPELLE